MSFLLSRKKIFLFVFLLITIFLVFFTQTLVARADDDTQLLEGASSNTAYTTEDGEAPAILGVKYDPNEQSTESKPSKWVQRIIDGIIAATLSASSLTLSVVFMIPYIFSTMTLAIASHAMTYVMYFAIYELPSLIESSGIKTAWEIFRNLANVGIIFSVVYLAIRTIIGGSGFSEKKMLGQIIIASLLLNFSFLMGAIVVDVSNFMADTVYKEIAKTTGSDDGRAKLGWWMTTKANPALFSLFINAEIDPDTKSQLEKTLQESGGTTPDIKEASFLEKMLVWPSKIAMGFLLGSAANFVLVTVFLIVICMICGRIIAILLLLTVSPLAFAALTFPNAKKHFDDWLNSLLGHSFFLPVFFLFILVGLKILEAISKLPFTYNTNSDSPLIIELMGFALKYLFVIGIFIAALIAAKKIKDMGSAAVGKISATVSSTVGGALLGAGAFAGRNTIGAGASALRQSDAFKNFTAKMPPIVGGMLGKSLEGVAKNTFDARNSRVFKGVASATGIGKDFSNTLKPAKDGFKGQSERLAKNYESIYGSVPDKDDSHPDIAPLKAALDLENSRLKTAQEREATIKKSLLSRGVDLETSTVYQNVKTAVGSIESSQKAAQKSYEAAKNPVRSRFVEKVGKQQASPTIINNVTNFWTGGAKKQAVTALITKEDEAAKLNKKLLSALDKLGNKEEK